MSGKFSEIEKRHQFLEEFDNDPWMGYPTLEAALDDYKASTGAEVMSRLLNRENLFIGGPAGAGKSTIIKKFIEVVDTAFDGKFNVALTASTGIAASLIGGHTIHSWAGLGITTEPFSPKTLPPYAYSRREQILYTDVLIIDEISMLPAYVFERLDKTLQYFRRNSEPFGGIQVVLLGDFMQLPPVDRNEEGVNASFAAYTKSWVDLNLKYCYMDKVHRASDPKLQHLLFKMSNGKLDQEARDSVESRIGAKPEPDKTYSILFTTNKNVDNYNQQKHNENHSLPRTFIAETSGVKKDVEKFLKERKIPAQLTLKINDTVMVTTNYSSSQKEVIPNGAIGRVTGFSKDGGVSVRFNDGKEEVIRRKDYPKEKKKAVDFAVPDGKGGFVNKTVNIQEVVVMVYQIPLKLAYAVTVHKSQGQTLDAAIVDLRKCFTPGLGYVAFSRVRSLDDLIIQGISNEAFIVNEASRKLTIFIKKKALASRAEFIELAEYYRNITTTQLGRSAVWDINEAGETRRARDKGKTTRW